LTDQFQGFRGISCRCGEQRRRRWFI